MAPSSKKSPHTAANRHRSALSRRQVLGRGLMLSAAALPLPWLSACRSRSSSTSTQAVTPPPSGLPPLRSSADANGLFLPAGFSSRVIAESGRPVGSTGFVAPLPFFPDGAHCFVDPDNPGGWILVVNSEVPGLGGAVAFRFAADGSLNDAYSVLRNSNTNCAGGATPWGTWISCEEVDDGTSWETHPLGEGLIDGVAYPVRLNSLGIYKHEAAAVDAANKVVYLTEDQSDGCLYRFVGSDPYVWDGSVRGDLTQGKLQVAVVSAGGQPLKDTGSLDVNALPALTVNWVDLPNATGGSVEPTRAQVTEATIFNGGEGCWFHKGSVYFTTKGDNRVWQYRVADASLSVFYDDDHYSTPVLTGVDNVIVEGEHNHVIVAEDGGNLEAVAITPDFDIAPLLRLQEAGNVGSEVTGLAFNPARTRLYFNSQRGSTLPLALPELPGSGGGVVYEIRRDDGLPIFGY